MPAINGSSDSRIRAGLAMDERQSELLLSGMDRNPLMDDPIKKQLFVILLISKLRA